MLEAHRPLPRSEHNGEGALLMKAFLNARLAATFAFLRSFIARPDRSGVGEGPVGAIG
jgi:hypothetical protein